MFCDLCLFIEYIFFLKDRCIIVSYFFEGFIVEVLDDYFVVFYLVGMFMLNIFYVKEKFLDSDKFVIMVFIDGYRRIFFFCWYICFCVYILEK